MGRRSRRREDRPPPPAAPTSEYRDGAHVLELRGVLTPKTRREYAKLAVGAGAQTAEDLWQRRVEFLFERLAVAWTIAGAEPLSNQKELLGRYRFASADERRFVRDALRAHVAEHFPDVEAP